MEWKVIVILQVILIAYCLIGAAIFIAIERPNETESCEEYIKLIGEMRTSMMSQVPTAEDLNKLVRTVIEAGNNGVQFNSNQSASCAYNWEFNKAFLFAGTVVTTIGYGHISPVTRGGQIFCIFYAVIGIPLFGVMLAGFGGKLSKVIKRLEDKLKNKIKSDSRRSGVTIFISIALTIVLFSVIPAIAFTFIEGWSYRESYYFTFITLTTVGFGDFVAGQNPDMSYSVIYRVIILFWLLLGLVCMATVISQISNAYTSSGKRIKQIRNKKKLGGEAGPEEENQSSPNEEQGDVKNNVVAPTEKEIP